MKKLVSVFMLFVLALCLAGCSSLPSRSELNALSEAVNSLDALLTEIEGGPQESTIHRIPIEPQVFEDQSVTITLVGVEEIMEVPAFYPAPPAEGHRFVVFEFDIRNANNGDFAVSSLLNFIARAGGEEHIFSMPALVALEREFTQLDFVVSPDESKSGLIGFELPIMASVIEIEYQGSAVYTKSDNTEAEKLTSHIFTYER